MKPMERPDQAPTDPWAPFEPTESDPWDFRRVARLHRAAGFGATWPELRRDRAAGPAASVARFFEPPERSGAEGAVIDGLRAGAVGATDPRRLRAAWLYQMLFGGDPLRERLTLFWHNHFATSLVKVDSIRAMDRQVATLRDHALGNFSELLAAMVVDPAMLVWLDGGTSRRERPNENFAREFLELFTLGPGHYAEADIRAAARAFTGSVPDGGRRSAYDADPGFVWEADAHDAGPKTFLGQTGPWRAADIIRITLDRPAAAHHLARKLYRAFVAETPEPAADLIEPLAAALRSGRYAVRPVLELIFRSRHFAAAGTDRRRVKAPVEFTVGILRQLEVPRGRVNLLAAAAACGRQGQDLFAPPSVKGWDGGPTWLTSSTLIERLNWATDVVRGDASHGVAPFDPLAWADAHGIAPAAAAATFATLLLQDDLDPATRAAITDEGRAGTVASLRQSLQRLLHCPGYELA